MSKLAAIYGRWGRPAALLGLGLWLGVTSAQAGRNDGHAWLATQLARVQKLRQPLAEREPVADFVHDVVDLEAFATRTYGKYLDRSLEDYNKFLAPEGMAHLLEVHQQQLYETVSARLTEDLQTWLATADARDLALAVARFTGDEGEVTLGTDGANPLTLQLRRRDGQWRIEDVGTGDQRLSRSYRKQVADILDHDYSLAVLQSRLQQRQDIVLEDFTLSTPGRLPEGWGWRQEKDEHKTKLYRVREQGHRRYLAAQDTGASVILLKWSHWNPRKYPIMTWCWRVDALPPGGDERFDHTNDSAAGIYVYFSENWLGVPRHIKYVWSTTLPEGTMGRRKRIFRPYFFVLESGDARRGEWVFETTDIEQDHRRVYGNAPKKRTSGIGLLTDANSTDSYAEAYYADIRVWSRDALEQGLVIDYCDCLREMNVKEIP